VLQLIGSRPTQMELSLGANQRCDLVGRLKPLPQLQAEHEQAEAPESAEPEHRARPALPANAATRRGPHEIDEKTDTQRGAIRGAGRQHERRCSAQTESRKPSASPADVR